MANTIDLNGRIAVVTGGAQGIGRAIVERLLMSGAARGDLGSRRRLAEHRSELRGRGRAIGGGVRRRSSPRSSARATAR